MTNYLEIIDDSIGDLLGESLYIGQRLRGEGLRPTEPILHVHTCIVHQFVSDSFLWKIMNEKI